MADKLKEEAGIDFPALIKNARTALGETQSVFAKRFGTHANTVSRWESGEYQAPYAVISFVVDRAGVSIWSPCATCNGTGRVRLEREKEEAREAAWNELRINDWRLRIQSTTIQRQSRSACDAMFNAGHAHATAEMAERVERLEALLKRIHDWDHMDTAGDGKYWREQILVTLLEFKAIEATEGKDE